MNRWRARLAELQCNTFAPAAPVQIVQIVQKPAPVLTTEHFEQIEHPPEPLSAPQDGTWTDAQDERAAIAEYDGGAPRAWGEALARLDRANPPADVPLHRWRLFIDDCGHFLDQGWANRAQALGWGPLDLFGCDRERPLARIDHAGLLWLLHGRKLVAITTETASIETQTTGVRQTYRRQLFEGDRIVLAWELMCYL
jgi:hypothetical protein